ncbi:sigma-70 family RNA polymerase sigma factor, partial [bacterium]|nr:sigma-70 family RNA polymerase sigma factor [bacterium]
RRQAESFQNETDLRCEVYKTILSIEDMQEAEVPTQIKSEDKTPEENIEFSELKSEILQSIKKLPQRERELIEEKFFKDKKLRELAEECNISQSRISRIIQAGLDKVKKDLRRQGII